MIRRTAIAALTLLLVAAVTHSAFAAEPAAPKATQPAAAATPGEAAIKDIAAKTAKVTSATFDILMHISVAGQGSIDMTHKIKYQAPDKFSLASAGAIPMSQTVVSNGTTMWTYIEMPQRKICQSVDMKKMNAALKEAGQPEQGASDIFTKPLMLLDTKTSKFEGTQQKDNVKCYVFSGAVKQGGLPMAGPAAAVRIYVGVDDGITRAMEMFNKATAEGDPMITMTFSNISVNPAIPAETFNFVAPEGVVVQDNTDQMIETIKRAAKPKEAVPPAPEGSK